MLQVKTETQYKNWNKVHSFLFFHNTHIGTKLCANGYFSWSGGWSVIKRLGQNSQNEKAALQFISVITKQFKIKMWLFFHLTCNNFSISEPNQWLCCTPCHKDEVEACVDNKENDEECNGIPSYHSVWQMAKEEGGFGLYKTVWEKTYIG